MPLKIVLKVMRLEITMLKFTTTLPMKLLITGEPVFDRGPGDPIGVTILL